MSEPITIFPAPIGGAPLERDLAPSILFACLNGILVAVAIARFCRKSTRTAVAIRMFGFVVDRTVLYSLRAAHARNPAGATGHSFTIYMQISYAVGYLTIFANVTVLLRCLIVGTTYGTSTNQEPAAGDPNMSTPSLPLVEDHPRRRFWYRRLFDFTLLLTLLPGVFGIIMGSNYVKSFTDVRAGFGIQFLRYLVTILAIIIIVHLQILAAWALFSMRRINRLALVLVFLVTFLSSIVPIYHLVAMRTWTTSLLSTEPGSQNTPGEKAAFYVLQSTPEFVAAALLTCINIKEMFGTGVWGDRWADKKVNTENA